MEARIDNWQSKSLSFAGRLQLITSVLSSVHIYWASVFILPARIIADLEKKMRGFLWCHGPMKTGKAKVKWKDFYLPKYEGGLGIRRVHDMNKSLMATHVWSIVNRRNSLWVHWIYDHKLKGRSFWEVPARSNISWGWRKLLQHRDMLHPHIRAKIGNGRSTSAWYDNWLDSGPLYKMITPRQVMAAGFTLQAKVANLINTDSWKWPEAWYDLFPVLITTRPPNLALNVNDTIEWRNRKGLDGYFSTTIFWDTIRYQQQNVSWVNAVWFPHCIPRHSFHMWLVCRRKLKTHDKLKPWEVGGATNLNLMVCPLCMTGPDSHDHLFFQCIYSMQVWYLVKDLADLRSQSVIWDEILTTLLSIPNARSIRSVIGRLLMAATSYFIWQERNNRLFSPNKRSINQLRDLIVSTVRLKLLTMKFKKKANGASILDSWQIPIR